MLDYDDYRLPEDYVHRVGRAARAGRTGLAMSLVSGVRINAMHTHYFKLLYTTFHYLNAIKWLPLRVGFWEVDCMQPYSCLKLLYVVDLCLLPLLMQKELELLHGVEAELGKEMEEFECKEKDVLADITKVSMLKTF